VVDGFYWVGNHPGVDFVNTEAAGPRGEPLDLIESWDDVMAWAVAAGLVAAPSDGARSRLTGRRAGGALDWARRLRAGGRQVLDPRGDDPAGGADLLAETVADVPVRLAYRLDARPGTPPVDPADPVDGLRLVLALAVLDAAQLDRSRVRCCEGERCVLLFYDTSKNRSRRWCDMAACGNRAKAAAHYQRARRRTS
jgi:predicted RNA-binding Zn ribbon-like protein